MNRCPSGIRELLPEFVHGFLDPEENEEVTDHLQVCRECVLEVQVLRQLADEVLPDPGPWYYDALPGKVTAEIRDRRKRRMRVLIPAWAGGLAAAALAVVIFLLPGTAPDLPTGIPEYASLDAGVGVSMGLEEEILSVKGILLDDLDQVISRDLGTVSEDSFVSMSSVFDGNVYETMDEDTIMVFESLLEEMTPEKIRKKVMS
jgi:hypothetical protein